MGHKTIPTTNTAAEVRRLQGRIAVLERAATAPAKAPEVIGSVTIEERENRVRVSFPGKPSEAVRSFLKSNGFRWAPSVGAWIRTPSEYAWSQARKAAELVAGGA